MQLTMDPISLASSSNLRWHLVFTKPRGEDTAKINLERQGYRVYFPRVQQKILSRDRWRDAIDSLFPRYLFVQLNATLQSLAPIRSTLGVVNVVRFGNNYVVVPDKIVDGLISYADPDTGLHQLCVGPLFEFGSAVRITSGVLAGLEGIFEGDDANNRVVVLLNLLGREMRIRISAGSVIPSRAT